MRLDRRRLLLDPAGLTDWATTLRPYRRESSREEGRANGRGQPGQIPQPGVYRYPEVGQKMRRGEIDCSGNNVIDGVRLESRLHHLLAVRTPLISHGSPRPQYSAGVAKTNPLSRVLS